MSSLFKRLHKINESKPPKKHFETFRAMWQMMETVQQQTYESQVRELKGHKLKAWGIIIAWMSVLILLLAVAIYGLMQL